MGLYHNGLKTELDFLQKRYSLSFQLPVVRIFFPIGST